MKNGSDRRKKRRRRTLCVTGATKELKKMRLEESKREQFLFPRNWRSLRVEPGAFRAWQKKPRVRARFEPSPGLFQSLMHSVHNVIFKGRLNINFREKYLQSRTRNKFTAQYKYSGFRLIGISFCSQKKSRLTKISFNRKWFIVHKLAEIRYTPTKNNSPVTSITYLHCNLFLSTETNFGKIFFFYLKGTFWSASDEKMVKKDHICLLFEPKVAQKSRLSGGTPYFDPL